MKKFLIPLILIIVLSSNRCTDKKSNRDNTVEADNKIVTQALNFPQSGEDIIKVYYLADPVIYVASDPLPTSLMDRIIKQWINVSLFVVYWI